MAKEPYRVYFESMDDKDAALSVFQERYSDSKIGFLSKGPFTVYHPESNVRVIFSTTNQSPITDVFIETGSDEIKDATKGEIEGIFGSRLEKLEGIK